MIIAVIIDGKVENIILCESIELARSLIPNAVCIQSPEGVTIGDDLEEE